MKLILGLGNPGSKYDGTRHNVGFGFIDLLRSDLGLDEFKTKAKLKASVSEGNINDEKLILAKPETFMNLSGEALVALKSFYKLDYADILVVYDDYDLPLSEIRYRDNGSAGTHNGMRSCIELLGSGDFPRLRIGINPGFPVSDLSNYVLGRFTDVELPKVRDALDQALHDVKKMLAISGENE